MEKRHKSAVTEIEAIVTSFVAAIQSRHCVLLERLELKQLVTLGYHYAAYKNDLPAGTNVLHMVSLSRKSNSG